MFLKRSLILASGVLLFLIGFIVYFAIVDAQMESRFRQERATFGVEGNVLTSSTPPPSAPVPATSSSPSTDATPSTPAPATPAVSPDATAPSAPVAPSDNSTPPSSATPDNNVIIGPLPPSSAPTPAPKRSASEPVPPSTTLLYPGVKHLSLLLLSGYLSNPGPRVQIQGATPSPAAPITITVPATDASATNTVTTLPAANAAPVVPAASTSDTAALRPMAVPSSVIVLLYHQFVPAGVHVPPKFQWTMNVDVFAGEMKYLHDNGYHVIPMSDLLKFLKHEIGLPPNSVVITIDDGYKSAIVYAAPILKQYGFPWTFFVYPDFITVNEGSGAASWNDLLALQADGVDIESHSMTHPQLSRRHQQIKGVWHNLSPEEYDQWLTNETAGAKALLEQKLGRPVTCFAYPFGDYNKQVEDKVIAAGYEAIFTVAGNPVRSTTSLDSIGRYTITTSEEKYFTSDLRQGALGLAEVDPAPGATTSNPRPVITAVIGYAGTFDPNTIETEVHDFGLVKHDYDPTTSTVRLYLPHDLIQPVIQVTVRVKDPATGHFMVANWRFNYESAAAAAAHPPIGATSPVTNAPPTTAAISNAAPVSAEPATNQAPIPMNSPGTR